MRGVWISWQSLILVDLEMKKLEERVSMKFRVFNEREETKHVAFPASWWLYEEMYGADELYRGRGKFGSLAPIVNHAKNMTTIRNGINRSSVWSDRRIEIANPIVCRLHRRLCGIDIYIYIYTRVCVVSGMDSRERERERERVSEREGEKRDTVEIG